MMHRNTKILILLLLTSNTFVFVSAATSKQSLDEPPEDAATASIKKMKTSPASVVNQVDNQKPSFVECDSYKPILKEEQPVGTPVLRVTAIDPDPHQTIEYSFMTTPGDRVRFRIDNSTGEITSAHIFDRDEPIREKETYISVRATDNGRPPLDDVCTFRVKIADINDNPPVFDKVHYDESVKKDTKVNQRIGTVSATDMDDGDNNIIKYKLLESLPDSRYFKIDKNNGVLTLIKPIDRNPGQQYSIRVRAYNPDVQGEPVHVSEVDVKIHVMEWNKRPPYFSKAAEGTIQLNETFRDYSKPIATFEANSHMSDKPEVIFELIQGRTEQTNSKHTFLLEQINNTAEVKLGRALDYEAVVEYTLTVSVKNSDDLIAESIVKIIVLDENDIIPVFPEISFGSVQENEPPGTPVMQVMAYDSDGTSANNIVSYRIEDDENQRLFQIDATSGLITTLEAFDRERTDSYQLKVVAEDNSPSALYRNGKPNSITKLLFIKVLDKNDNIPVFTSKHFVVEGIAEDENINTLVIEVNAKDDDESSQIRYAIVSGNEGSAFKIDQGTGRISINNRLDYETTREYMLTVQADDGIYRDHATVVIKLTNINDNPPRFEDPLNVTILEETIPSGCIMTIQAYDPDIENRDDPQHIKFFPMEEDKDVIEIDDSGCLRLRKALDRDLPYRFKQFIIIAIDEDGAGRKTPATVRIILEDINDNAPRLTNAMPVLWGENRSPGLIVKLTAEDLDEPKNGAPFNFGIDPNAPDEIKERFQVQGDDLYALVEFDREEQKEYRIPIRISDSGQEPMSDISILHLVISDDNDNEMRPGESRIFVYNYKGEAPNTEIGRVYVDDPDDWDLSNKTFHWDNATRHHLKFFDLNKDTGMITMLQGTPGGEYELNFHVIEQPSNFSRHKVAAKVTVTVKEIPEEAVDKSGSIRFHNVTAEEFVSRTPGQITTPKERLQASIANTLNVSRENVDVFTVLKRDNVNGTFLDVRFSAHGSPYYAPEKLNGMLGYRLRQLEEDVGFSVLMVGIDECIEEGRNCELSCKNTLYKSNVPIAVYTNTSSFVGVNSFVQAECICVSPSKCLNGGFLANDRCSCLEGFEGPHCEMLGIGFYGNGYALYPPVSPCDMTRISIELTPQQEDGLVMYIGPLNYNPLLPVRDFLALELVNGIPVLLLDYGSGTMRLEHQSRFPQDKLFTVEIVLQPETVEMIVDNCRLSTCMSMGAPKGLNRFLNVNAPLQLGGTAVNLDYLGSLFNWTYVPQDKGFSGCLRNLTINERTYDLGLPSFAKNIDTSCMIQSVVLSASFVGEINYLVPIFLCIIIMLILLQLIIAHRQTNNEWSDKEVDEAMGTVISYEEEGGGESDTKYDRNVLVGLPPSMDFEEIQYVNINNDQYIGYLLGEKLAYDEDAAAADDLRCYAYEGDQYSYQSLSSLTTCSGSRSNLKLPDQLLLPNLQMLAYIYNEESSDSDK